jgi:hypothetical protein
MDKLCHYTVQAFCGTLPETAGYFAMMRRDVASVSLGRLDKPKAQSDIRIPRCIASQIKEIKEQRRKRR